MYSIVSEPGESVKETLSLLRSCMWSPRLMESSDPSLYTIMQGNRMSGRKYFWVKQGSEVIQLLIRAPVVFLAVGDLPPVPWRLWAFPFPASLWGWSPLLLGSSWAQNTLETICVLEKVHTEGLPGELKVSLIQVMLLLGGQLPCFLFRGILASPETRRTVLVWSLPFHHALKLAAACETLCVLKGPKSGLFWHTKPCLWHRELAFRGPEESMAGGGSCREFHGKTFCASASALWFPPVDTDRECSFVLSPGKPYPGRSGEGVGLNGWSPGCAAWEHSRLCAWTRWTAAMKSRGLS